MVDIKNNKAYIIKNLDELCTMKTCEFKEMTCSGRAGEIHCDMKIKKKGDKKQTGLLKVEYSFDGSRFLTQQPDKSISNIDKLTEVAYDIKIPKRLQKNKTIYLKIRVTYEPHLWSINFVDTHEKH